MCCSPRISCNGWRTRSVVHDVGSEALTFDGRTASGGGGGGGGTAAVAAGDQPAQRIDTGGQGDIAVAAGAVEEARNDVSWPHRFVGGGWDVADKRQDASLHGGRVGVRRYTDGTGRAQLAVSLGMHGGSTRRLRGRSSSGGGGRTRNAEVARPAVASSWVVV